MMTQPNGEGGFDSGNTVAKKENDDPSSTASQKLLSLSGAEWYSQQAHRAVNQAIGRVIRHRFDYGAILFLDSRYREPRNQLGVSKWIRPCFEPDKGVGPVIGSLVKFYREAQKITNAFKEQNGITIKPVTKLKYENAEDEVDKSKTQNSFVNGVTKLKVIEAAKCCDEAADDLGYIPKERVIKEVQLDDHTLTRNHKKSESTTASKIRHRMQLQGKSQLGEEEVKQQKRARFFFELAQKCLSSSDFDEMRKILILMKSLGDKKDSDSYLVKAKHLLNVLLRYDPCRCGGLAENTNDELVESLLPLLPVSYRFCIEKMACQIRYDNSTLKEECKKLLNDDEYNVIESKMYALMVHHDRSSESVNATSKRGNHLGDYHEVLKVVSNHENGNVILNHIYPLIPKSQLIVFRTLAQEYQARRRIREMKNNDKSRYGEKGVKTALFQRPVQQNYTLREESKPEDIVEMKEALFRASSLSIEHKQSWEASRSELLKQNLKRKNHINSECSSKSAKLSNAPKKVGSLFSKIQSKAKSTSPSAADHVDKCLAVANTETFKKATSRSISMDQVKSNVPVGTVCSICNNLAKQVSAKINL